MEDLQFTSSHNELMDLNITYMVNGKQYGYFDLSMVLLKNNWQYIKLNTILVTNYVKWNINNK